ncbi:MULTISPECIES: hypothetical protein [Ralstonia solanacearum species complex]|uniref:hypothetical protein n=1 Tax=Ralstonia solanacearum species complex TaxID=3116862 RepID=UPI001071B5A8|nr:hypothetical protein [Ralstonia solanacearum]
MDIDFRVVLDDGSLLTAPSNRELLDAFKRFLCLQTHPARTGGRAASAKTARQRIALTLHILDYFLLRAESFELSRRALAFVTADDVTKLVETLASKHRIKDAIYEPKKRIVQFLRNVRVSHADIFETKRNHPELFSLPHKREGCSMSVQQLRVARTWLHRNGYYYGQKKVTDFSYRVVRTTLLETIIGHRVLSGLKFDGLTLEDFDVSPVQRFQREKEAVPVSNADEDERAGAEFVSAYVSVLESMRVARKNGIPLLTDEALAALDESEELRQHRTKDKGRFTTLPFEVANSILSHAIEFYYEYGTELVEYYLALAKTADDIRTLPIDVPPKLKKLGIEAWRTTASTSEQFFIELRRGNNLLNMLEVLYGAILIIVNTLMARRKSELERLTRKSIVDSPAGYFLAFDLGKANVGEHRSHVLRPLPDIAAEALQLLGRLTAEVGELGYQSSPYLFAAPYSAWHQYPPYYGTVEPDFERYFDRFCDYFQVATDEKGRRFYVRSHLLRRNFAMLFIWHGSFGGIEVLRYFLGQIRPSHTYRYITESIPGKALRRIHATVANDLIRANHTATQDLADFLCQRYGITLDDLHILPERDVIAHVEELLESGEAEVEPEFFDGPNGEQYRFVYKVHENYRKVA